MAYPDSIYSPRARENWPGATYNVAKKTIFFKEDCDAIENEIVAVETELGLEPKGDDADVAERLDRLENSVRRVATVEDIDFKTLGTTLIYTVPTGKNFVLTALVLRTKTYDAPNGDGIANCKRGSDNAGIVNPISPDLAIVGFFTQYVIDWETFGASIIFPADDTVVLEILTAETGTALTFDVDLIGYLVPA